MSDNLLSSLHQPLLGKKPLSIMHLTAKTLPTPKAKQSGSIRDAKLIDKSMPLIPEIGFGDLRFRQYFLCVLTHEVVDYGEMSE